MKFLFFICSLFYITQLVSAQTVNNPVIENDIAIIKKPLLLTIDRYSVKEWSIGAKEWNSGGMEYWSSVNSDNEKIVLSSSSIPMLQRANDQFSMHSSMSPLFHYSNVSLPHNSNVSLLHGSNVSLLHGSTAPLLHSGAAPPQTEDSKIGSEIYYFLGAAALAAVIYFLVPDNQPASKPVSTFGLPVTPK